MIGRDESRSLLHRGFDNNDIIGYLTEYFTLLEPHNSPIDEANVVKKTSIAKYGVSEICE